MIKLSIIPLVLILLTNIMLSGCANMATNMAGKAMVTFGENNMMPYFMASSDTEVMCSMGEGLSPMIMSFGKSVDEMVPLVTQASGMCADLKAKEQELRYIRAMRSNDSTEAQDARTMQKRYLQLSAERNYEGYKAIERRFGDPAEGCPKLSHFQELYYLMGIVSGVQALLADVQTGGTVGVPLNLGNKVLAGVKCMDNNEWWGLPEGIEAMSMMLLPGEYDKDPNKMIENARRIGKAKGVYMINMLLAILYDTKGDQEKLRAVIRDHVETLEANPGDPNLKFLNAMTTRQIELISDRLWTENTGQRTPFGKLGSFWDEKSSANAALDIDELL